MIFGTHMLRKTGYLLAKWGWRKRNQKADEIEVSEIAMSARHKDVTSMISYLRDNGTLFESVKHASPHDPKQNVGKWIPIHLRYLQHWKQSTQPVCKEHQASCRACPVVCF
jgi:hypothetical protein